MPKSTENGKSHLLHREQSDSEIIGGIILEKLLFLMKNIENDFKSYSDGICDSRYKRLSRCPAT